MNTQEIGNRYVALCKEGKGSVCFDELYAKNAVSVEAMAPPGTDRTAKGLDAIRAKGKDWQATHVVHRAEVTGPFPNDNRFGVRFVFDVTDKPSGKRMTMDEIGLFTIEDGKITREEFFYPSGD